jgi:hypothetical protein
MVLFIGLSITTRLYHRYLTVVADPPRKAMQFGNWQYEVKILSLQGEGSSVCVGWEVPGETERIPASPQAPEGVMRALGQLGEYQVCLPGLTSRQINNEEVHILFILMNDAHNYLSL